MFNNHVKQPVSKSSGNLTIGSCEQLQYTTVTGSFPVHAGSLTRTSSFHEYLGIKCKDSSIASLSPHCSHLPMAAVCAFCHMTGVKGFCKVLGECPFPGQSHCVGHMLLFFSGGWCLTSPHSPPHGAHAPFTVFHCRALGLSDFSCSASICGVHTVC